MNVDYLITGTNSGLGKRFSIDNPNALKIERSNNYLLNQIESCKYIIHCAFSSPGRKKINDYYQYYKDNIKLIEKLTNISHKKFIYISSIEVYEEKDSLYKSTKLICEAIVQKKSNSFLIIRPSSMVGYTMKNNTIKKIAKGNNINLTLSEDSLYNLVLHKDIVDFVNLAISDDICGIVDAVSTKNIKLSEIVSISKMNKNVNYGSYVFSVPTNLNLKTHKIFDKTSNSVLEYFLDNERENYNE